MKVYLVVCPPSKGLGERLNAITVLANSKEEALSIAQNWADENGYTFSRPFNLSDVETSGDASAPGVINCETDNGF